MGIFANCSFPNSFPLEVSVFTWLGRLYRVLLDFYRQGPARYEGPVSWKELYTKMLMAGEVESIEVVTLNDVNVARVYLYPDAIYNGMRLRRSYFSLDMGRYDLYPSL